LLDEGNWNGKLKHRTKAGRELTVESRIILEKIDGRRLALEGTRDVTERKAWETQQKLLLRELTHRVKNTLTVVQSIVHQTRRFSKSYEEFIDRLDGRLDALQHEKSVRVERIVERVARQFLQPARGRGARQRARVAGRDFWLERSNDRAVGGVEKADGRTAADLFLQLPGSRVRFRCDFETLRLSTS